MPVERSTENVLRLVDLAGRHDIPVAQGASRSWKKPYGGPKAAVHGEDGQGNTWSDPSTLKPLDVSAAEFIVQQILKSPNELTIAALGPLTNLADALKINPDIQNLVKEVVFMGGNPFSPGNTNPAAEANIMSDPEAADFVMGHKWSMTMVGLEVTQNTFLTRADIDEIGQKESVLGKHVYDAYQHYLEFYRTVNQLDGTWVHDSSVFTYLLCPELYKTVSHPVRVETAESISRGKTWPSVKDYGFIKNNNNLWAGRPKVKICTDVGGDETVSLLKSRLLKAVFP